MKKYKVWFTTTDGDNDKEWCYAESKEDAAKQIQQEHWDIQSIDLVEEMKGLDTLDTLEALEAVDWPNSRVNALASSISPTGVEVPCALT